VASFVGRTITFMQHEKRKFVPKIDYITSPGWLDGPDARKNAGLPEGDPKSVITNTGNMCFDGITREMFMTGFYPGITPQQIQDNMGFAIDLSRATEVEPPTTFELKILREKCDPHRLILG
jgi:glutaconate CoA-transferase subunit B